MNGYPNGRFQGDSVLTRYELAIVLDRMYQHNWGLGDYVVLGSTRFEPRSDDKAALPFVWQVYETACSWSPPIAPQLHGGGLLK
jgi:hypothetical protein